MKRLFSPVSVVLIACFACSHPQEPINKDMALVPDSIVRAVQTVPVVLDETGGFIKLNGKIEPNEAKEAKIFALASGKIAALPIELGDYVQKGRVLAVLKSSEIAGWSNDVSLASSDLAVAEKAMRRSKELFEGGLATEQEYLAAQMDYKKAVSELNRAKEVASVTGGENASYVLRAPISGFVIEKNVTNNSEVRSDNSNTLFTIADISSIWVMAKVYESDMSRIHLGDSVIVNTLVNPEKNYLGKIDKIYNVLDPETRTMQVRISMENPGNELKPEMFVTVKVSEQHVGKGLSIPATAIVMENNKHYVVIRNNNQLTVQEIQLLKRVEGKAFVSGLSVGDQVVTNSQVFLYQALTAN